MSPQALKLTVLAALLPALAPLAAQEAPPPRPKAGPEIVRERMPMAGRFDALATRRARLGVVIRILPAPSDSIGALLESVSPNGPAARAGLRSGDIITRFNGQPLTSADTRPGQGRSPGLTLMLRSAELSPGDTVVLQYARGTVRRNATVVAGDELTFTWTAPFPPDPDFGGPDPEGRKMTVHVYSDSVFRRSPMPLMRSPMGRIFLYSSPLADLELAPLNPELGRYFGAEEGVLVIDVPEDSRLGLKPGDVVFSVDGRKVEHPAQLLRALQSYEPGEEFRLEVMRMKKRETVTGSVGGE